MRSNTKEGSIQEKFKRRDSQCNSVSYEEILIFEKSLYEAFRTLEWSEIVENVMPVLRTFCEGGIVRIRLAIIGQIKLLFQYYSHSEGSDYEYRVSSFFPCICTLLKDRNRNVKKKASELLIFLASLINTADFSNYLWCTIQELLGRDECDTSDCVLGVALLGSLCLYFPRPLIVEKALPLLVKLSESVFSDVRRAAVSSLGLICPFIEPEEAQRQVPLFLKFTSDSMWTVRDASTKSLLMIVQVLPPEQKNSLVSAYISLSNESGRWTRTNALKLLGKFIYTFKEQEVPAILIDKFCYLADYESHYNSLYPFYCAKNFSVVLDALGRDGWKVLAPVFKELYNSSNFLVRGWLARTLHVSARVLGESTTERDLMHVYELFLRDLDIVRYELIKNWTSFLANIGVEKRLEQIYIVDELAQESRWRWRKLLASQLGELSLLLPSEIVDRFIVPNFFLLINDQVFAVRNRAVREFSKIVSALRDPEALMPKVAELSRKSYKERQIYAILCQYAIQEMDIELFKKYLLSELLRMSDDKVPNVRFELASAVANLCKKPQFRNSPSILDAHLRLTHDEDHDVKLNALRPQKI